MIVTCEKCSAQFNLNENMIREEGSKVRCSKCRHVFTVFPPSKEPDVFFDENGPDEGLEETISLDSPPSPSDMKKVEESDDLFDLGFEEVLQESDVPFDEIQKPSETGTRSRQKKEDRYGLLLIIPIIIVIILLGFLTVFYIAPRLLPDSNSEKTSPPQEETADAGNLRLEFGELEGKFLFTNKAGNLFIIKGEIINNYSDSRRHILVKATIEDINKMAVANKSAYAGNIFSDNQLKEMTMEEIDLKLKNKAGMGEVNMNVKPGETVPFMIIFLNLPDNLGDFEVETVSSLSAE